MIFDLRGAHLGDVLMAAPAMRAGDSVIVGERHRVPGLPVTWVDDGKGVGENARRGWHSTDAWLDVAGRTPVRHLLMAPIERDDALVVIAPHVADPGRRWPWWDYLIRSMHGAVVVDESMPRIEWMKLLARASAVICPNTGTAHMADALGVPLVIALYQSSKRHHLPYWNRKHCIIRDRMDDILPCDVMEKLCPTF